MNKKNNIAIMFAISASIFAGCYDHKNVAESQAREYIARMYAGQQSTVTCMSVDNDNNGYVTCEAIVGGRPLTLECGAIAGRWFFEVQNRGCRRARMLQVQQQDSE